jgi:hypothetical protein
MSKISTYPSAETPLLLSDRLIGTEAIRTPPTSTPLATKNFSLGELLQLFSSNFPAASLQAVLNTGNTATQNITLIGTIDATLIKPVNIEDTSGSQGNTFQFLSKGASSINWVDLPISNLQAILDSGNTATQNINLIGDITTTKVIPGNIQDENSAIGTTGQVLSKTATGIRWINNPIMLTPGLADVLSVENTATNDIILNGYIKPTNIKDSSNSDGSLNQILSIGAGGLEWKNETPSVVESLTVIGNSGPSTLISKVLNIPTYTLSGLGGQPLAVNLTSLSELTYSSVSFVKMTAAGTFVLDPNIYLTDAPSDGTTYGRNNGNWTTIVSSGGLKHSIATGTDVYTATISGVTSYADGDAYLIRFTNGNTTGSTLNINSLGAVPLYRNNDGPLLGGDITSEGEMLCVYNSTSNIFQVIGISPNSLYAYVTNADSVTITKGMPVYAFGGTGDRMTVKRAFNTGDATSAQTVGLVLSTSIAANQKGIIMMQGLLDGLSILPTSIFSDGDPIYLGATAGTITNVKPYAPNHLVYLGVVTTASNGSAGRMYVRVQNGYELDELHNVQARTPSLKDTLWYDNTVSPAQWKTASIATILGYTPANDTDVVHKTGNETIAGDKDFTSRVQAESGFWYTSSGVYKGQIINISDDTFYNVNSGRTHYFGMGNGVGIANVPNNASVPNGTFSILLQTADTIASFDANKNIVSLPLATYPSLTELSYVKGVTSAIQTQFDAVNVNVITITTAVSITTDTTSGSYGQHGRHVKISNGANAINIQCVSTSNADFVASYEKIGTGAITFTFAAPITNVVTLSGTNQITAAAAIGSKACLSRNGNVYYLQITNY